MALHLLRGGGSQEGVTPWQGRSDARLALLQPAFWGPEAYYPHAAQENLWPGHLLVMTQDDQGALQMDYPFIPSDCYYLGYLEEIPFSRVTVDTCYGGLRGFIKLDDLTYEINPMKESQRFEHVVSQIVADANAVGPMYPLGYKEEEDPCSLQKMPVQPPGSLVRPIHLIEQI